MRFFLIICFNIFLLNYVSAKNKLIYFGGGNSSEINDKNLFDTSFKNVFQYAQRSGWETDFYYRSSRLEDLSDNEKSVLKPISAKAFNDSLGALTKDIEDGRMKKQDQLFIFINTHGSLDKDKKFTIAVGDENVDIASLERLALVANDHNVKLGIIGHTCYSGVLQKLKSDSVCIISASQADKVGFQTDSISLTKYLVENKDRTNLEDLYVKSRWKTNIDFDHLWSSQPMISTAAGRMTDKILLPLRARIISQFDEKADFDKRICLSSSFGLNNLKTTVQNFLSEINTIEQKRLEKKFQDVLLDLKNNIELYDQLRNEKSSQLLKNTKIICPMRSKSGTKRPCYDVFFINRLVDQSNNAIKKCGKHKNSQICIDAAALLESFKPYLNSLEYKKYFVFKKAYEKEHPNGINLEEVSEKIAKHERFLYDQLYKYYSEVPGPNPCRDFKL